MAIYKPTELIQFLDSLGVSPKKSLSQNFLIDGNIIRKIALLAKVEPGDVVLEIGPGPGALTQELLAKGATVLAVEKDAVFAQQLRRLSSNESQLQIFNEDILAFSLDNLKSLCPRADTKIKVIANLPYHVTTPILEQLVQRQDLFSSLTLMVQEEVARRFVAKPGSSDYSSFTLFLNFYSKPSYGFFVSRHCFMPSPKVDSAVVTLVMKAPPDLSSPEKFFEMTRRAFRQRRKMLKSTLREDYSTSDVAFFLEKIGCSPLARPEELSLEDFIFLFKSLVKSVDDQKNRK